MSGGIFDQLRQLFPAAAGFTEKHLPDLSEKVYIVTGANTGVGKELAQILYSKNARVYAAARSAEKADAAIKDIEANHPDSKGSLTFLHLDLADLTTIKASAKQFTDAETRLDVLFNNAGVMMPAAGSKTAQGYELQLGVNNVGTWMFTELLTPTLQATAKTAPENSVRVIWVASSAANNPATLSEGIDMSNLDYHNDRPALYKYMISKVGNVLHGMEYKRRYAKDGIVSVALNPGNLNSDLWRTMGTISGFVVRTFILHPPINGAYTELFAGLSPEVKNDHPGDWVVPWGRFSALRPNIAKACKREEEGGSGTALKFWEWTEEQVKPYL